jgi:hypothetical protein
MPEMKYYMVYANWKPEYQGPDDYHKAMDKYKKVVEKAGCKVVFWGAALGVQENALCVIKGTPENYMGLGMPAETPYVDTRTHVVITF